jgi:hypothetical protein
MSWYLKKPVQNSELLTGNGLCNGKKNSGVNVHHKIPPVAMSCVKKYDVF